MAVKDTKSARLNLVYYEGSDDEGNAILKRSGYEVKVDAQPIDLLTVGRALGSLSEFDLYELGLTETSKLDDAE